MGSSKNQTMRKGRAAPGLHSLFLQSSFLHDFSLTPMLLSPGRTCLMLSLCPKEAPDLFEAHLNIIKVVGEAFPKRKGRRGWEKKPTGRMK